MAASTKADSRGLVTTIMAAAPRNSTRLRSATDTEEPTAALIWVVSAVSREIISPVLAWSKKAADSDGEMGEHVAAQIGDDALAERGDEVVARGAGEREHGHDRDQHREIAVDQVALSREKPKSIMRRTAIGTTSVVIAATTRATSAAAACQR